MALSGHICSRSDKNVVLVALSPSSVSMSVVDPIDPKATKVDVEDGQDDQSVDRDELQLVMPELRNPGCIISMQGNSRCW